MRRLLYYAAALIVICGSFIFTLKAADYLGTNDSTSIRRYTFHDYYEQDDIDVLFLGSSQVFFSIDCGIMDEKLGKSTFDLGTASQRLNMSSVLLKDAVRRYHPEQVYVYLGYRQSTGTKEKNDINNLVYVTDNLRSLPEKYMMIIKQLNPDEYMNAILPVRRDLEALFDPETLAATLAVKSTEAYKNYDACQFVQNPAYAGKGHVAGERSVEDGSMLSVYTPYPINTGSCTDTWKRSIKEIIDFCSAEGIGLTFFAPPLPSCDLLALENQDALIQEINTLIAGTGVTFVDFSLLRKEYWPDTSALYHDDTHLNQVGAERFTEIFADYINGDLSADEIFYGSVTERFEDLDPAFYGASTRDIHSEEAPGKEYHLIGNPAGQIEYKVDLYPGDDQVIELQDFNKNDRIFINKGTPGSLKVYARLEGNTDILAEAEIRLKD